MKRISRDLIVFACLILPAAAATAQDNRIDGFLPGIYKAGNGKTMPYRLFVPTVMDSRMKYPLVLFLHGFEALGKDNRKQISGMDYSGSHIWAKPENQAAYPCFVLAPQCPKGGLWASALSRKPSRGLRLVVELIQGLTKEYPIDQDRLYVTGQSIGGFGTWALLSAYPEMFAAGIPVCGGGRKGVAHLLAHTPIWAFHGSADPFVLVFESRRMISAIRKAGGNPRYTEYPFRLHRVWDLAYSDPGLVSWLFQQRRGAEAP
jgi:predicted peptidase